VLIRRVSRSGEAIKSCLISLEMQIGELSTIRSWNIIVECSNSSFGRDDEQRNYTRDFSDGS
jgi:hypothetical protein